MRWLSWLKKPWIHFLLLGFLLFELQQQLFPEPKPVVGPLPEARIEALQHPFPTIAEAAAFLDLSEHPLPVPAGHRSHLLRREDLVLHEARIDDDRLGRRADRADRERAARRVRRLS